VAALYRDVSATCMDTQRFSDGLSGHKPDTSARSNTSTPRLF
jgi:hypothetical protein